LLGPDRTPQPAGLVSARGAPSNRSGDVETAPDGTFRIGGFAPGDEVKLMGRAIGATAAVSTEVTLVGKSIENVELILVDGGSISGIVAGRYGDPAGGVGVVLRGPHHGTGTTAGGGAFGFDGLEAGTYALFLVRRESDARSVSRGAGDVPAETVELSEKQSVSGLRLVFEEYANQSIYGTVVDDGGAPIAGAQIVAT